VNTARAMTLCAIGALVGLGIAGYGLFTASGTSIRVVPAEDVATVNQRPVLRSDFINQVEMETGKRFEDTPRSARLQVLEEMVREEILVQRGLELDFAETDQGTRNALVAAISDQAIAEVTTHEPTEEELQSYYRQHPGQWATEGVMSLRDFVLPRAAAQAPLEAQATALSALAALRGGGPIDQVITQFGLKEAQRQDSEYYFTVKYRLGDALFNAIAGLADGEFSPPVPSADGTHIVQMLKNQKPVPLEYRVARSQVLTDYNEANRARVMENTLKFLHSRATVLIAPDYARDYKP